MRCVTARRGRFDRFSGAVGLMNPNFPLIARRTMPLQTGFLFNGLLLMETSPDLIIAASMARAVDRRGDRGGLRAIRKARVERLIGT